MHPIERRSPRGAAQHLLAHPRYFETLSRYQPTDRTFVEIVDRTVPGSWAIVHDGGAIHAAPPGYPTPAAGFKIHVSSALATAPACLERVAARCVAADVAFKAILDPFLLGWLNSPPAARESCGKFITIYPRTIDEFKALVEDVATTVADIAGPYVLSDARFRDSRAVFYRYGGFRPRFARNVYGEPVPVYEAGQGDVREDRRAAYYQLPPGIDDPFGAAAAEVVQPVTLAGRYEVTGLLHMSNKGGVYRAIDRVTGGAVVLKEARPFVAHDERLDAPALLDNEHRILRRLVGTGVTPAPLDRFDEWEHAFLALELVPGETLARFRARPEHVVVLASDPRDALSRILPVIRAICHGLRRIHERDVIVGDLTPQNLLVDAATARVAFVDFETAAIHGERGEGRVGIPGFVSSRRHRGAALTFDDDRFALSRILYSMILPICGLFELEPAAEARALELIQRERAFPFRLEELVYDVPADLAAADGRIAALEAALARPLPRREPSRDPDDGAWRRRLEERIAQLRGAILASVDYERRDRVVPADWRVFGTNPLGLAFGATGVALFLARSGGVPDPFAGRIRALIDAIDPAELSPGLFVGAAGVAWAAAALGDVDRARVLMTAALASERLRARVDLFYGCSGVGLAALALDRLAGAPALLGDAVGIGEHVLAQLVDDGAHLGLPLDDGGVRYRGLAHGATGPALFLLRLAQASGEDRFREAAIRLFDGELAQARRFERGIAWESHDGSGLFSAIWRYGNAGIIPVALRFARATGEARYLDVARDAAAYLAGAYATVPGLLSGMAGIGDALVELDRVCGDGVHRDEARRFAERVWALSVACDGGAGFGGEDELRVCHDHGTGSAGVGSFYLRLLGDEPLIALYDP